MPYSDPLKKAKHYTNYEKPYMKKWKEENKDYWNEYQKKLQSKKKDLRWLILS